MDSELLEKQTVQVRRHGGVFRLSFGIGEDRLRIRRPTGVAVGHRELVASVEHHRMIVGVLGGVPFVGGLQMR